MTKEGNRTLIAYASRGGVTREYSERIAEVLVIMLDNADKFSPSGSPVYVDVARHGDGILVSVMDRGLGVPEEYRERVFERFGQVEEALHHSYPGMGRIPLMRIGIPGKIGWKPVLRHYRIYELIVIASLLAENPPVHYLV